MVSYKAAKANSKLTDFEDLREYVVRNIVKNVPRAIKQTAKSHTEILGSF